MSTDADAQVRECLWHLDADLEARGWDQPPQLFAVLRRPRPAGAVVGLLPLPGWDQVRAGTSDMQAALAAMTVRYAALPEPDKRRAVPQRALFGVALACEAWMLRAAGQRGWAQTLAVGEQRRVSEHPDRVEVRLTTLAPLDGPQASLVHERGGVASLWGGEQAHLEVLGAVPELLGDLAAAVRA